jgi:hypothetical protein
MLTGQVDVIERTHVAGWAADDRHPEIPISVVLFVNGQRYAQHRCDLGLPGLATAVSPFAAGHGFRFNFVPPLPPRLHMRIAVRFVATGAIVPGGERMLAGSDAQKQLKPILITAPGRSGTTMFMERLSRCKEVVIAKSHPYEIRMLSYYASAYHVLTAPADPDRSTHPDRLEGDGYFIGSNPFADSGPKTPFKTVDLQREFFAGYMPDQLMSAFKQIIVEYYQRHCRDQGKNNVIMFAEKNNNIDILPRKFTQATFGDVKEIVLVRDPRDLYCSRRSYFRQETQTAIHQILWGCEQLLLLRENPASDVIFVRYEDIIMGNPDEFRRVSDFLGFELPASDTTTDAGSKFATHATSQSPQSSIARWRQQMTADEVETFGQSCHRFFEAFGYDRNNGELTPATSVAALRPHPAAPVETARPANATAAVKPRAAEIGPAEAVRADMGYVRPMAEATPTGSEVQDAVETPASRRPERLRFVRQISE